MYIVIRTYADAGVLADTMLARHQEVSDVIGGVSGFVAYYATRDGDNLATVTVCDSHEGTEESTRLAGEWIKQNLPGASIGVPKIVEGETFLQF